MGEVFTIQALPLELRGRAIAAMAALVAPGGRLVAVARTRADDEPLKGPPWPLSDADLELFVRAGLRRAGLERFDEGDRGGARPPGVRPGGVLAVFGRRAS